MEKSLKNQFDFFLQCILAVYERFLSHFTQYPICIGKKSFNNIICFELTRHETNMQGIIWNII
jgi:hypothetical protein